MTNYININNSLPEIDKPVLVTSENCKFCLKHILGRCHVLRFSNVRIGYLSNDDDKLAFGICTIEGHDEAFCKEFKVTHWCEIPE